MIDLVLAAVIAVSTLLGFVRGFVGIVAGTLSWLLGGWAAFQFGNPVAQAWAAPGPPGTGHIVGAYLLVFIAVMVVVSLIGLLLRTALRAVALGGVDRLLGGGLGVLRGGLICAVLLLVAGFTSLPSEPVWQQSRLRLVLQPVVGWMQSQLADVTRPIESVQQMLPGGLPPALDGLLPGEDEPPAVAPSEEGEWRLGKPGATGDNGVLGEVVAGRGWPRTVDPARGAAEEHATAPAPSADRDPAPTRPGAAAPARNGSPGQAWPPSL